MSLGAATQFKTTIVNFNNVLWVMASIFIYYSNRIVLSLQSSPSPIASKVLLSAKA